MFGIVTPSSLFHTQLFLLQATLPAVLNGESGGIHDARIATRRLRELLPLMNDSRWLGKTDDLNDRFRRLGRSLGRVRDADVRVALVASLEERIPHSAPVLVIQRQRRERERLTLMRKLIKRLERLDAARMVAGLIQHRPARPFLPSPSHASHWRRQLRTILADRTQTTSEAIAHATGVYFPKRTHATRITIKKLRYAMEIAHATGHADQGAAIRELKKSQDILGDLHDRQALIDDLGIETDSLPQTGSDDRDAIGLICQVLEAEVRHLHEEYLARRHRVVAIVRNHVEPPTARPSFVAVAGTLALSTGAYLMQRRVRTLTAGHG